MHHCSDSLDLTRLWTRLRLIVIIVIIIITVRNTHHVWESHEEVLLRLLKGENTFKNSSFVNNFFLSLFSWVKQSQTCSNRLYRTFTFHILSHTLGKLKSLLSTFMSLSNCCTMVAPCSRAALKTQYVINENICSGDIDDIPDQVTEYNGSQNLVQHRLIRIYLHSGKFKKQKKSDKRIRN